MTIRVIKKEMIAAVTRGGMFAAKNKVIPILENIKIAVKNNILKVVSSCQESTISYAMEIIEGLQEEETFCVNAGKLKQYLGSIEDDVVSIKTEDSIMYIEYGSGVLSLPIEDSKHFPVPKLSECSNTILLDTPILHKWIDSASLHIKQDSLRPIMGCMNLFVKNGELGFCATDSLSLITDTTPLSIEDFEENIPKGIFDALKVCMQEDTVQMKIYDNNIMFTGSNWSILSVKIAGKFPNFNAVIPRNYNIKISCNRKMLLSALQRSILATSKLSNIIALNLDYGKLTITGTDKDFNTSCCEEISVENRDALKIGMNGMKLIDCIRGLETEDITMEFTESNRPVVMKESGNDTKIALLMPCNLN